MKKMLGRQKLFKESDYLKKLAFGANTATFLKLFYQGQWQ